MTRVLKAERRAPVSGDTRSIVVFLHGYGANGADLLGLRIERRLARDGSFMAFERAAD